MKIEEYHKLFGLYKEEKVITETCPLDKTCVRIDKETITHRCKFYMPFTTFLPGDKEATEVWKCAMVWIPNLLVEQLQMARAIQQERAGIVKKS